MRAVVFAMLHVWFWPLRIRGWIWAWMAITVAGWAVREIGVLNSWHGMAVAGLWMMVPFLLWFGVGWGVGWAAIGWGAVRGRKQGGAG